MIMMAMLVTNMMVMLITKMMVMVITKIMMTLTFGKMQAPLVCSPVYLRPGTNHGWLSVTWRYQ